MKKLYSFTISLLSIITFSQQLDADLYEINYKNGIVAEDLFSHQNKILFRGAETSQYSNPLSLWSYDFATQKSSQIYNIRPETGSPYLKGNKVFVSMGNKAFFIAQISSQNELWSTNGTANGMERVFRFPDNYQMDMTASNDKIFISYQNKVYISDGSSAGTKLLKEMDGRVLEGRVITYNNYFFFAAQNANYSNVLWMTNGNDETFQLKDLDTDEILYIHTDLSGYELNGKLLFYGRTATGAKNGLWSFDNVSKKAKFIATTTGALHGQILNGKLIFQGWDSVKGGSLFVTDGTTENTQIISPTMHFLTAMGNQDFMSKLGNYVYFFPSYQNERNRLWKTDGTVAGTVQTNVVIPDYASPEIIRYYPQNDKILIENASHNLWWLMDTSETVTPLNNNNLNYAVENGNKLIFPYSNTKNGNELFQYDFSTNAISLFHDGNHKAGSVPNNITLSNQNELIFTANDGENPANQFYKVSNSAQPERVGSINYYGYGAPSGKLFKVGNYFYVQPNSYTSMVTKSGGTGDKTKALLLPQNNMIDQYSSFGNLNDNSLIFTTYYSATNRAIRVWKNDKDSDALELIKEIPTGNLPSTTKTVTYNGEVYFIVETPDYKREIWKTDGTAANTKVAVNVPDFSYYSHIPTLLQVFDGKLLINKDEKLYAYDSVANTLSEIVIPEDYPFPGVGLNIAENTREIDGKLYMLSQHGYGQVYRFDNLSTPPTKLFSENFLGSKSEFKKCGNQIFFANGNAENLYHSLWSFNLDNNATNQLIANNNQGTNSVKDLVCVKNYLYFLKDGQSKIWRTTGNPTTTVPLNINVTNDAQIADTDEIQKLTALNDKLYFVAKTATSGEELYYVKTELPIFLNVGETGTHDEKTRLILYPNPTADFFKVKNSPISDISSYHIYDLSGKLIKTGKYLDENQIIDVSTFNNGTYIIKVNTKKGASFSEKFIKK